MPKYIAKVRVRGKMQQRTYYAMNMGLITRRLEHAKAKRCVDIDVDSIELVTRNEKEVSEQ